MKFIDFLRLNCIFSKHSSDCCGYMRNRFPLSFPSPRWQYVRFTIFAIKKELRGENRSCHHAAINSRCNSGCATIEQSLWCASGSASPELQANWKKAKRVATISVC